MISAGGSFYTFHSTKTSSGTNQPPTQSVLKAVSLGVEQPRHEAHCLPPFSAEVKNV
jgi:hypothetical protein